MNRIVGIDVARAVALLGMYVAHVGTAGDAHPPREWLQLADGRSAATFALLAGVSIALLSGGSVPKDGLALRHARARIAIRAVAIYVLGDVLVTLGTPVMVILPMYALLFVLAIPLLRVRRRWLLLGAVVAAFVGPVLVNAVWMAMDDSFGFSHGTSLLVHGGYPALVWVAYLLVGLGVGRLDLRRTATAVRLALVGVALAVLGYGSGRALELVLGPSAGLPADETRYSDVERDGLSPLLLGYADTRPHADSPPEVIGNVGVALLVLAVCLLLTHLAVARVALWPLAATGSTALTAYTLHIVAIRLTDNAAVYEARTSTLLWFIGVTVVAASVWRAFLGRGPLERVVHGLSLRFAETVAPGGGTRPAAAADDDAPAAVDGSPPGAETLPGDEEVPGPVGRGSHEAPPRRRPGSLPAGDMR